MAALKHAIFLTVIAVIAVIAAGIVMWLFAAFYGVAIGLGTWLPNIMTAKAFTITKSLTYTFGSGRRALTRPPVRPGTSMLSDSPDHRRQQRHRP
jgi:hypothetical protein